MTQLESHACFCPPTMHDTKLYQLNKVRMEEKASIAKAKPVTSHKTSTFQSPLSGLATIKQPGQATMLQASAHCESKGGSRHQASISQTQCRSLTQRNVQHQHVSSELHKEIFVQATNTKHAARSTKHYQHLIPAQLTSRKCLQQKKGFINNSRSDTPGGVSLAKLSAKHLLVLCTTARAVLGALNCPRMVVAISRRHLQWFKRCFGGKRSCCCCLEESMSS